MGVGVAHALHVAAVAHQCREAVGLVGEEHSAAGGMADGVEEGVVGHQVEAFQVERLDGKGAVPCIFFPAEECAGVEQVVAGFEGSQGQGVARARGLEVVVLGGFCVGVCQVASHFGLIGGLPVVVVELGMQCHPFILAVDAFGRHMQAVATGGGGGEHHQFLYQLVEVVVAARHQVAVQPPAPQPFAHDVSPTAVALGAESHQGAVGGVPSDFGIEERLHSRCGAVVAERGCQRGEGFNASADVGIDGKEGEGIVAAGCHFLRHTPFGGNLHAAVQRVETGHVGLCADNVHQGQGGGERLHPAEPFGIAGHIVKDGHIPVLHLLAFGGGGPEGRGKHLHRIVGVAFDSLFQRSEVGMGGCGHNGHFAPTVQHFDNHRAAVVGRGGLAGRGRQGDSVALQPCAVGVEGDVERLAEAIVGKRHGLGDYRPAFVRHRQGGAFALQKVGAYGDLHGELAARIGYPVASHFRHPGIAPAGGVAQCTMPSLISTTAPTLRPA